MPPKQKKTKEEVLEAALKLVKEEGQDALTARRLAKELDVTAPVIFRHFSSMEELNKAVIEAVREEYNKYVQLGLSMNLPFKGYAMEMIRFATECPTYFELLFIKKRESASLSEYIGAEGNEEKVIKAAMDTFEIDAQKAEKLYHTLWIYVQGISSLIVCGACSFSKEEIGRMLGEACRGALISINSPEDERWRRIPTKGGDE